MLYREKNEIYSGNKNRTIPFESLIPEKIELENNCFDCGCRNPELISINNGIFICNDCGLNHKSFQTGISLLINNNPNYLTEKEIKFLKYGGNKTLYEFILLLCPNLINLPRKYLYSSPILYYYRKRLQNLVENDRKFSENKKTKCSEGLSNLEISSFLNKNNNNRFNTINYKSINNKNETIRKNKFRNYDKKENYEEKSKNYLLTRRQSVSKNKKSSIIYNKPKLNNKFNILSSCKTESNDESKNSGYTYKKINPYNFDNIKKNTIKNDLRKSLPLEEFTEHFNKCINKNSSKTLIKNNENNITDDINYNHLSSYQNTNLNNSRNNKGEKRIKEIVINKKINKYFYTNHYRINTRTLYDRTIPIQVNVSFQNTIDNTKYNNNKKSNNYISDINLNETPTIIIHNSTKEGKNNDDDSKGLKIAETKNKYNINTIEIKFTKNLKKENQKEDEKQKMNRTMSEKKIKTININFIKNKKNKIFNNENKINKKLLIDKKKLDAIIKKENVEQFQILPIKIFKKIIQKRKNSQNFKNDKNSFNKNDNDNKLNKNRKMISPKKEINSNKSESFIKSEYTVRNKNNSSNSYKKIMTFKLEETFKNSIRNKYKREKIMQENKI